MSHALLVRTMPSMHRGRQVAADKLSYAGLIMHEAVG